MRLLAIVVLWVGTYCAGQGLPAAVVTDPVLDAAHPPRMEPVRIPVGGVLINGVLYVAGGAGVHPTVAFFHGMPGNEQNLDLAQAMRRAGWNVLTMHYRGSWGSPGTYGYQHQLEDGRAAVAFLRDPHNVALYGIDVRRIVVGGHSTGGFVAVNVAATVPGIAGLMLISGTDDAGEAMVA
ncbi:MAG: alpha/beta hydrolase, partial [Acidobacteriota bacterium]